MSRSILQALVAAFVLASTLLSCAGKPNDPANLTAIDSMLVQVDSLSRAVNALDTAAFNHMESVFAAQKERLEAVMRDTLDRQQALAVGNYFRAMTRSLARVRTGRNGVLDELAADRAKLQDLRHDVAGGLLPEGPERTYVDQERLYLADLAQRASILMNSAGTVQRNWDEHHARVDSILAAAPTPIPAP